jgi:hypothetical protein
MFRRTALFMLAAGVASAGFAGEGFIRRNPDPVKGSYIVTLADRNLDVASEAASFARTHGGTVSGVLRSIDGFVILIPEAAADSLSKNPKVNYIEEVAKVRISDGSLSTYGQDTNTDTDPASGLWHLDRIDEKYVDDGLSGYYAWCGAANARAYMIDTGVRADHSFFKAGQVVAGPDYSGDAGTPTDPCSTGRTIQGGHGTATASIVGSWGEAETCPQTVQTPGVAKGITIVAIRAYNCIGGTDSGKISQALQYVIDEGVSPGVVTISGFYSGTSQSVKDMITHVSNAGFPVFVAANNFPTESACNRQPAAFSRSAGTGGKAITVGGTMIGLHGDGLATLNLQDYRWQDYSINSDGSWGAALTGQDKGSCKAPCIDIWAPARRVLVANYTTTTGSFLSSGTSYSAPMAAGVAARYLLVNGGDAESVWTWMSANATRTGSDGTSMLILDTGSSFTPGMLFFEDWCWTRTVCR